MQVEIYCICKKKTDYGEELHSLIYKECAFPIVVRPAEEAERALKAALSHTRAQCERDRWLQMIPSNVNVLSADVNADYEQENPKGCLV